MGEILQQHAPAEARPLWEEEEAEEAALAGGWGAADPQLLRLPPPLVHHHPPAGAAISATAAASSSSGATAAPTVACFYSVSSLQSGLSGVDLGNFLIKQASALFVPLPCPRARLPLAPPATRLRAACLLAWLGD